MSDARVAVPYAKSLLDLAREKGLIENIYQDMLLVKNTCNGSRPLVVMLGNPIVQTAKKAASLKAIFDGKVSQMTSLLFELLCRKGREAYLYAVSEQFILLYNEEKNIQNAVVYTPFELTAELRSEFERIVKRMSGKQDVELEAKTDESLIGGYVLRIGDRQVDDSVRTRIQDLRKRMIS
ncbi:MAG: ATP synthase F1 subunit delta [Cytophagales bacterium]|nr:MAG: ATP synthase F1 subunit delta [Cytophagales bacterium]TAF61216.1 MAG: ATP synthase F1 subunit delta [Cytophagales bacterium]